jgi:hypothetical protein
MTAVVPAVADSQSTLAVVGFDREFFLAFPTPLSYKVHNSALKYFRDICEGFPSAAYDEDSFLFSNTAPHAIPAIKHNKGPQYTFEEKPSIDWRWQEMVAKLEEPSLEMVLQGLRPVEQHSDRSRGSIVSCRLQKTDRYDHKRHHAMGVVSNAPMMKIWDFVLTLDNGTELFLHPNYGERKFAAFAGVPETDHEYPRSGMGGTSGPGTFRKYKQKKNDVSLRFKPDGHAQPKAKAKPKALTAA